METTGTITKQFWNQGVTTVTNPCFVKAIEACRIAAGFFV